MGEAKTTHSFLVISLVLLILVLSVSNINSANAEQFLFQFPPGPVLPEVRDVKIDSSGNVYALLENTVTKFDSLGNTLLDFESSEFVALEFGGAQGMSIDSSGNVYVADNDNSRIQKFDSEGSFISSFGWGVKTGAPVFEICTSNCQPGSGGSGDGQFSGPSNIAFDSSGNIYVSERDNDRIQKFDSSFLFQGWMGKCTVGSNCDIVNQKSNGFSCTAATCLGLTSSSGDGQFSDPRGIDFDSSGNIYVADKDNHRIQKFDSAGTFQGWMGRCDAGSNCDSVNEKSNGFSCTAATCSGLEDDTGDGQFWAPHSIAFDSTGNIYVSDRQNNRVQKFDSAGTFQGWMGKCTAGSNCDIVTEKSNGFSCTAATCSGLDLDTGNGQFESPRGISFDSSGNLYVADLEVDRIQKFNPAGTFELQFGTHGSGDGKFERPRDVVFDSSGNIYVGDRQNFRVQKFDSSFLFQGWMGKCIAGSNCDIVNEKSNGFSCTAATCSGPTCDSGDGQFCHVESIALDSLGNIYVADSRIQKFDSAGAFQGWLGGCDAGSNCDIVNQKSNGFSCTAATCSLTGGPGDGQFSIITRIAFDSSGNLYVAEHNNGRVQKFDSGGTFQGWMGKCIAGSNCDIVNQKSNGFSCTAATCTGDTFGSGNGQFSSARGIAFDSSGNIYVADSGNSRIQKFDSNGTFELVLGSPGSGDGQFNFPGDVAFDSSGNIYVADSSNDRVQKFDSDGTFESKFGSLGRGVGEFDSPFFISFDSSGNIYVSESGNERIQKFGEDLCNVPESGHMTVKNSCQFLENAATPANVIVRDGAVMTITNGVTLDVDFENFALVIENGPTLIENGGFEIGPPLGGNDFLTLNSGDTSIPNWEVTSGSIDYGNLMWKASKGLHSIDLSGTGAGSISQSFPTEVGRQYKIEFDLAGNFAGAPTIKTLNVTASSGDQETFTFDTAGRSENNLGWVKRTFFFNATDTATTVTFSSLDNTAFGPVLDNVKLPKTGGVLVKQGGKIN